MRRWASPPAGPGDLGHLHFNFKKGKDDSGSELAWSGSDKPTHDQKFSATLPGSGRAVPPHHAQHRAVWQDVGVIFDIRNQEDMAVTSHSH